MKVWDSVYIWSQFGIVAEISFEFSDFCVWRSPTMISSLFGAQITDMLSLEWCLGNSLSLSLFDGVGPGKYKGFFVFFWKCYLFLTLDDLFSNSIQTIHLKISNSMLTIFLSKSFCTWRWPFYHWRLISRPF